MGIFEELKRRNVFRVVVAYTIVAWLVAQIADLVLNNIGAPEWVMPALFLMLVLGFFAALVISWAYELTPDGIKRERDVVRDDSITDVTAKKLDYITIAAVAGVLVMFVLQQNDSDQAATRSATIPAVSATDSARESVVPDDHSIAVLPFANRSNQDEDLFFTDGIHDDLLTQLAKIKDLKVISRTSVMQYRDTDKHIPQIARELGVATILEGGVQRAGHRIRINAQLIDVATDEHLWAETFDREMTIDNLFDIQTEITRHIVTAVRGELSTQEQQAIVGAPTHSLEAYEAFLHANSIMSGSGYNVDKYTTALPFAEQAVALDPDFAMAHLMLAEIHAQTIWIGYDITPQRQQAARASLQKAAAILAPGSPELLAARSEFLYRFEQDYPAALDLLQRAHAAMPGDTLILEKLGFTQRRVGLWEESVNSLLRVIELDPVNASAASTIAENLAYMQQWPRLEAFIAAMSGRFGESTEFASVAAGLPLWSEGDLVLTRTRLSGVRPDNGESYYWLATELPWYERDFAGVIEVWDRPEIKAHASLAGYTGYRDLQLAMAYKRVGNANMAAEKLAAAVARLTGLDRTRPAPLVAQELNTLAQLMALQGDKMLSIATAEESTQVISVQNDDVDGRWHLLILSRVLAQFGERDRALAILEQIIGKPSGPRRWELYLDPRWDFFRDDERFVDLIRPHNLEQSSHE